MASKIIRPLPIYVASKKIAEVTDGTYDITSNDESQVTHDGYIGHSDGATTCKADFNTICPVAGHEFNFVDLILNKQYVNIGILADGKLLQFTGRLVTLGYTTDSKSGKATGKFSFEGGPSTAT